MTIDALLNILLAVVVPLLMAALGGILAAKTLPSEVGKLNPEKWLWIASFIFIFLVSVVLGFVQQVRSTAQEKQTETKAHEKELRDSGEIKYMQGQLDSIGKIMSNLSSGSDPKQTAAILKGILPILAATAPDVSLQVLYQNGNLEGKTISIPFRTIRTGPGAPAGYKPEQQFTLSGLSVRNDGTRSSDPLAVSLCFSVEVIPGSVSWAKRATNDASDAEFPYCVPMEQRKENSIVVKSRGGIWDIPAFFGTAEDWNAYQITAQVRITAGGPRPLASTFTINPSQFKLEW